MMLQPPNSASQPGSLMSEYAGVIGDSVLQRPGRALEPATPGAAAPARASAFDYISNMSHELRTPLGTILGFAKILTEHDRRRLSDVDILQYAQFIHQASPNLLGVITSIIEFARIQSGNLELSLEDLRPSELVLACIEDKQIAAREAGLRLDYSIASGVPLVRADEARLRQILSHLIDNSIKFTEPGGLIHVAALSEPGVATLIVRDTGVGMSAEDVAAVLASPGQNDRRRSQITHGARLGLPTIKGLVELHGGQLRIASAKSQGTEVHVCLPAAYPAETR